MTDRNRTLSCTLLAVSVATSLLGGCGGAPSNRTGDRTGDRTEHLDDVALADGIATWGDDDKGVPAALPAAPLDNVVPTFLRDRIAYVRCATLDDEQLFYVMETNPRTDGTTSLPERMRFFVTIDDTTKPFEVEVERDATPIFGADAAAGAVLFRTTAGFEDLAKRTCAKDGTSTTPPQSLAFESSLSFRSYPGGFGNNDTAAPTGTTPKKPPTLVPDLQWKKPGDVRFPGR